MNVAFGDLLTWLLNTLITVCNRKWKNEMKQKQAIQRQNDQFIKKDRVEHVGPGARYIQR